MKLPPYKKYILFILPQYYPAGGLGDIKDSFDTIDEAEAVAKTEAGWDDWEIIDRDTWIQVA